MAIQIKKEKCLKYRRRKNILSKKKVVRVGLYEAEVKLVTDFNYSPKSVLVK